MPLDKLASSIKSKRTRKPYTNYRSDAIQLGMKQLKDEGKANKTKVKTNDYAELLPSEIDKIDSQVRRRCR